MPLWGKIDNEASKPKYLSDELRNDQTVTDRDATIGIDRSEAAVTENRAKGLTTPGWTKYRTYVDGQGKTRHKAEVLVAFAGDFTTGDNDTIPPNPVVSILTQPEDTSVVANVDDAIFTVSASATRGATVTYQWQSVDSASVGVVPLPFVNVSGATSPTLNAGKFGIGDNGTLFRVIVAAVGATPVTSNTVTLTVVEAAPEPEPENP
jgi:hypothetical protein